MPADFSNSEQESVAGLSGKATAPMISRPDRRMFQGDDDEVFEDTDVNPELDSFHYMEVLIQALSMMGQLPAAIAALKRRFRVELFDLAERTADEVRERRTKMLRDSGAAGEDTGGKDLQDYLIMLYRRLEVVMQAHLFVLEVIRTKLKRAGLSTSVPLYTVSDVWDAVQDEVKSILSIHLTQADASQKYASAVFSLNDLLRNPSGITKEGEIKVGMAWRTMLFGSRLMLPYFCESQQLFHLPDPAQSKEMESLYRSIAKPSSSASSTNAASQNLESSAAVGSLQGSHRLLATADARRVLAVYRPTFEFTERMESVLATESAEVSDFKIFLDDFILNVLLPKVEDEILEYFHELINGEDAFQAQVDEKLSPFPLLNVGIISLPSSGLFDDKIQSVVGACALLESMGVLLHHLPVHKDHFVNIMEVVMWKFSEKCVAKYRREARCVVAHS